jgi:hypothetical protein
MQEPITLQCNHKARVTGAPFAALLVRMRWGGFNPENASYHIVLQSRTLADLHACMS